MSYEIQNRLNAIMSQIAILKLNSSDSITHQCIKYIGEDIEKIQQLLFEQESKEMSCSNNFEQFKCCGVCGGDAELCDGC